MIASSEIVSTKTTFVRKQKRPNAHLYINTWMFAMMNVFCQFLGSKPKRRHNSSFITDEKGSRQRFHWCHDHMKFNLTAIVTCPANILWRCAILKQVNLICICDESIVGNKSSFCISRFVLNLRVSVHQVLGEVWPQLVINFLGCFIGIGYYWVPVSVLYNAARVTPI